MVFWGEIWKTYSKWQKRKVFYLANYGENFSKSKIYDPTLACARPTLYSTRKLNRELLSSRVCTRHYQECAHHLSRIVTAFSRVRVRMPCAYATTYSKLTFKRALSQELFMEKTGRRAHATFKRVHANTKIPINEDVCSFFLHFFNIQLRN